jgi:GDP-L-fucose synthase
MEASSRIYIAGHKGLVGSAITKNLESKGYRNLILRTIEDLDLTDQKAVDLFFKTENPEYVILAAALVGGIVANNTYRADFIYQNIMIQSNIIHSSWKYKVKKLLFLGSTCIYPKNAPQPLKEETLLSSPLEYTNEPYAIAKIAGLKMCESFNLQYGTNFISVMPTNLYGPGDNFNLEKSHVLPALLRKIYLGRCLEDADWDRLRKDLDRNPIENVNGSSDPDSIISILKKYGVVLMTNEQFPDQVTSVVNDFVPSGKVVINVWGTGTPLREFMYSTDMADACVYIMENVEINDIISLNKSGSDPEYHPPHFLNIGTGEEISIKELVYKIKKMTGYKGEIAFDASKPDGTMRKVTDIAILKSLGYTHKYNLDEGLKRIHSIYSGK